MATEPPPPRHRRRTKRARSWDTFLQLLLFTVVAVVAKEHFGLMIPWPP